jgi:hypothetical protein
MASVTPPISTTPYWAAPPIVTVTNGRRTKPTSFCSAGPAA